MVFAILVHLCLQTKLPYKGLYRELLFFIIAVFKSYFIMKKFLQLILHFYWLKSPCRRADIFK